MQSSSNVYPKKAKLLFLILLELPNLLLGISLLFFRVEKLKTLRELVALMAGVVQLQKQLVDYTNSLFNEGFLDDQFNQLQQLQDESNPDFVVEVVNVFFEDSKRLLNELEKSLVQNNIDFKKVDAHVHQLKGSSSSIGAQKVQNACISLRNCCEEKNVEGCLKYLQQVKDEFTLVRSKLETLFMFKQQLLEALK